MRNWKIFSKSSRTEGVELISMEKEVFKQDPNYTEKVADLTRLNKVRSLLFSQVFKLLIESLKDVDYKIVSCSYLNKMDPSLSTPLREFRFLLSFDPEEAEE